MIKYRYDLHVHTSEVSPCGKIPGRLLAELYKDAGYAGIVITDHFCPEFVTGLGGLAWPDKVERFMAGYREAEARGAEIGLDVFFGLEMRFAGVWKDYLVYGPDAAFLAAHPDLAEIDLARFRELSAAPGYLVFQAHPFRSEVGPADPRLLDGVEVYNGNPRHDSQNHLAWRFAEENGLRMIAGSDCHQLEDVGRSGIEVRERLASQAELIRILREERTGRLIGIGD